MFTFAITTAATHARNLQSAGPDAAFFAIGNSITYFNGGVENYVRENLDAGVPTFATVVAGSAAGAGLKFVQHLSKLETPGNAWSDPIVGTPGKWDWVLLQEQSQLPSFFVVGAPEANDSLNAARRIAQIIRQYQPNAKIIWFQTWGYRNGDAMNPELSPDFLTMEGHLEHGYNLYSMLTSSPGNMTYVAPVGRAFKMVYLDSIASDGASPALNGSSLFYGLYRDGSHPSEFGSDLAGKTIYATITGRDPRLLPPTTWDGNKILAAIAYRTVLLQETFADNVPMPFEFNLQDYPPYLSNTTSWNGVVSGIELVPAVRYSSEPDTLQRGLNPPIGNPFLIANLVLGSQNPGDAPGLAGGRFVVAAGSVIVQDTVWIGGPNGAYGALILGSNGTLATTNVAIGPSGNGSGTIYLRGVGSRLRIENRAYVGSGSTAEIMMWNGTIEALSWETSLRQASGVYRPLSAPNRTKVIRGEYVQETAFAVLDLMVSNTGSDQLMVSGTMILRGSVLANVGLVGLPVGSSMTMARASAIQVLPGSSLVAPSGFALSVRVAEGSNGTLSDLVLVNNNGTTTGGVFAQRPASVEFVNVTADSYFSKAGPAPMPPSTKPPTPQPLRQPTGTPFGATTSSPILPPAGQPIPAPVKAPMQPPIKPPTKAPLRAPLSGLAGFDAAGMNSSGFDHGLVELWQPKTP
jgi:hypothetical protein